MRPQRIISGGQTGADRAGLDAALELGIPIGGYCPKGRRAEDGIIASSYGLIELDSRGYRQRTLRNVAESDATVVFTGNVPTRGSQQTMRLCELSLRPLLRINVDRGIDIGAHALRCWLTDIRPVVLNVAGSRASKCPEIYRHTKSILIRALMNGLR